MQSASPVRRIVGPFIRPLLDFLYPLQCLCCHSPVEDENARLCVSCWRSIMGVEAGHPIWEELSGKLAADDLISGLCSCFLFEQDGPCQALIHALKYEGMSIAGIILGRHLGSRLVRSRQSLRDTILMPVPLNPAKKRERGYNQSDYLCRGIADVTGLHVASDLLHRIRHTHSQTKLSLEERRANVAGAFAVNPKSRQSLDIETVILVDDVITTGSTILACARELRRAGVRNVVAASVALAR